jgi:hypothetical protein
MMMILFKVAQRNYAPSFTKITRANQEDLALDLPRRVAGFLFLGCIQVTVTTTSLFDFPLVAGAAARIRLAPGVR